MTNPRRLPPRVVAFGAPRCPELNLMDNEVAGAELNDTIHLHLTPHSAVTGEVRR